MTEPEASEELTSIFREARPENLGQVLDQVEQNLARSNGGVRFTEHLEALLGAFVEFY